MIRHLLLVTSSNTMPKCSSNFTDQILYELKNVFQNDVVSIEVDNVVPNPMRRTSAFFASSVSQPTASTSSLPNYQQKRSASFGGKVTGIWPIPAKKCAVDVDALDMATMVYKGRVGTLGMQTIKDWLNKVQVPYSSRYRKEELVQVVVNFIRSLDAMPSAGQQS
jgi:hypothetical protein